MPRVYPPRGVRLVRHYVRKRTYGTADRVLVHLSAEALQPQDETQEGIAAATRSGRSTLTKWLDRLEHQGLVVRERIRLPGHPLPKYGYRLTEEGWRAAATLRGRLTGQLVTVRTPNLGALSVRLSEVERIAAARLDLTGAIASVHRGQLDLARPVAVQRERGPLRWGSGLRRVDRFFGRAEELRDLDAWWASDSRALLLTGLAGIGKSALVAAWIQGHHLNVPVFGVESRPSSTAAGFLSDLGAFLTALGKPALATHLAEAPSPDLDVILRLLRRDLSASPVLLIVDNADQTSREAAAVITRLFLEPAEALPARVVLLGRRLPRWMSRRRSGTPELQVRQVHGLDVRASRDLLRSHGLGPDSALTEEIVQGTKGHPLLLHLAATTGSGHGSVVRRYLEEEVWGSLTAKDRSILEALSVFRGPVTERVLGHVAQADHRSLQRLAERNLLERTIAGGYVVHDLVREFVQGQLAGPPRERYHERAAGVLLRATDSRDRWEGVYHLLQAGRVREAAALLDSEGAPLLDSVAAEDIAKLVRSLTLDEDDPGTYCVFAELLGDSLRIRGHVAPARFQYGHARRLAETSGQTGRIPRILRKLAFLERCRNRYPKALGNLVEARARLLDQGNRTEMVEVLREMALAEQALGQMEEAAHHLNEAVDLATETADRAALSRTLLALGSLETQRGRLEQGLELDLEGLRIAERSGNVTEIAHGHIVVGAALIAKGSPNESVTHFKEALEVARLLGNLRLLAYGTMNYTSALLHLRRYKDAATSLQESADYFGILEEKDALGLLKTYEGEVEMGLGRWSRAADAWREGIKDLRSHGSPADLALVLRDAAGFFAKQGATEEGQSYLLEALEIARRVGSQELVSRIDSDLSQLRAAPIRGDGN